MADRPRRSSPFKNLWFGRKSILSNESSMFKRPDSYSEFTYIQKIKYFCVMDKVNLVASMN